MKAAITPPVYCGCCTVPRRGSHSRSSNGFFKPLLDPDGRFTSETAVSNGRYTAVSEVKRTNI